MKKIEKRFSIKVIEDASNLDDDFLELVATTLSDPQHLRFSRQSRMEHSRDTTRGYVRDLLIREGKYFQIWDLQMNVCVGTFTLTRVSDVECEAGILIFPAYSGKGVGSYIWKNIPQIAADSGYRKMFAGCHKDNLAMIKLMKSIGMADNIRPKDLNYAFDIEDLRFFELNLR